MTPFRKEVASGEYGSEQRHDNSPGSGCGTTESNHNFGQITQRLNADGDFLSINVNCVPRIEHLWSYRYLIFQSWFRFELSICRSGVCGGNRYLLCIHMPSLTELCTQSLVL